MQFTLKASLLSAIALALFASVTPVSAQSFPTKPVRAVVPFSAGSGPDSVVRMVGEKLNRELGQQLVVDNKPGANGWLTIGEVKRTPADGYNLMLVDATHMSLQQHLYKQMPFDPVKDFDLVAPLYTTNFFIVVSANSPWKSVSDLIAAAKAKDNEITYGSWGIGSVAHVGTAMLESATGTQMRHIPFKELPQLYTAVSTGEVDWAFGTAASAGPLYKAKKVKFLAYAGTKRLAGYTDVPTVGEAGGPNNFELNTWVAFYAPKGVPKATVDRLYSSTQKAMAEPDVKERLNAVGFEPWMVTPADATKVAEADRLRFAEVVKKAKISVD